MLEDVSTAEADSDLWVLGQMALLLAVSGATIQGRRRVSGSFLEVAPCHQQWQRENHSHAHPCDTCVDSLIVLGCLEHVTRGLSRRSRFTGCSGLTKGPLLPGEPKRGHRGLTAQSMNGSIQLRTQVQSQGSCALPCHATSTEPSEKGPTSSLSCCQVSRWFVCGWSFLMLLRDDKVAYARKALGRMLCNAVIKKPRNSASDHWRHSWVLCSSHVLFELTLWGWGRYNLTLCQVQI